VMYCNVPCCIVLLCSVSSCVVLFRVVVDYFGWVVLFRSAVSRYVALTMGFFILGLVNVILSRKQVSIKHYLSIYRHLFRH
jgi:hypothetical protein